MMRSKHFSCYSGKVLNTDAFFIAQERAGLLEMEKVRLAAKQRQEDASAVLADLERRSVDLYDGRTHFMTLKRTELKVIVAWKLGGEKVTTTKSLLMVDRHSDFDEWTRDDRTFKTPR